MTQRTDQVEPADVLESTPPGFGAEAARRILRATFGIEAVLAPQAGERDQNFRAEAADGRRYLLKISNPADRAAILDMQAAALRHIEQVDPGLPVTRCLPSTAGQAWAEVRGADGRTYPVRLFTFLPGRLAPAADLHPGTIRSFGETTARLGKALRGFFHPAADYAVLWSLRKAAGVRPLLAHIADAPRRAQVAQVLDRFEDRVAPALPGLRAQVIHGDMSLANVLFSADQRITGIVDFGDMSHAPLVCDLAVAIAEMHGHDDPLAAAELLIDGYTSVVPLSDDEADVLADLVAARLATEVAVTAWRVRLYPENTAYAASSEPAARAFLDVMDQAGPDAVRRRLRDASLGLPYRHAATASLLKRRRRVLPRSPLFYADPVHLVRGEGVWLTGADGRRYLDCYNNVQVAGHCHPRVTRAVTAQQRLATTHSRYLHEAVVELAERLRGTLPGSLDAVLVLNSGSEANDLAWRISRAATGRGGAIVSEHAYHGLTEATHALSPEEWATGERPAHIATVPAPDGYRGRYRREQDGWELRYAAHVDTAAASLAGSGPAERGQGRSGLDPTGLAAMYAEPAFTADGIFPAPPGYLQEVARRVRGHGGLLVADEVQAGHGRTGTGMWAFRASGIEPDMVVMGKPMGNGFPVAALVVRADVLDSVPHETELFSTFGGNPVACAAALAVLDVIEEEGLVRSAAEVGGYLLGGLRTLAERHDVVGDVRGSGLLLGVELVDDRATRSPAAARARAVVDALRERGVLIGLTGPDGNVLKVRPPLVFGKDHADLLLEAMDEVLALP